jgi:hypothetical protein
MKKGNRPVKRATLVLDYGARKFNVIMNDDLEPVISREDGKEVKSLPAPAKDDDPELVKVAKAEFTAAKKTVKDVVKLLAEQLYEAVCNQRTWGVVEWKRFWQVILSLALSVDALYGEHFLRISPR